jgi:hypothetical protein
MRTPHKIKTPAHGLTDAQVRSIAMEALDNALTGRAQKSIVERLARAQAEKQRNAELKAGNMGYPQHINGVSFIVPTPDSFACSGGGRLMHWLAAMLAETGAAVATTSLCIYNPMIPVRRRALPTDIAILSDGHRFDSTGASRVFWWMLYFAEAYFKNRIKKGEGCLVYDKTYLSSVQAHCDYPLTDNDIFFLPHLDPQGCYPGRKTIQSCIYGPEAANKSSLGTDDSATWPASRVIPGAMVMPAKTDIFRDGQQHYEIFTHQRTLAILRAARHFYTVDYHTAMSVEAALCGCRVWYVQKDGSAKEQFFSESLKQSYIMNPVKDIPAVEVFKNRVLKFFGA